MLKQITPKGVHMLYIIIGVRIFWHDIIKQEKKDERIFVKVPCHRTIISLKRQKGMPAPCVSELLKRKLTLPLLLALVP